MEHLRKVAVSFNISYRYVFGKLLGKGNFAKVHLATRKKDGTNFAIKTVEKTKILENPRNTVSMQREINILRRINHPNVIQLYEVYENDLYVHLVLEYLRGGELFQYLQNKGLYSEKDASQAIKRILEALDYCHNRFIVHRDLKPENLILVYAVSHFPATPPASPTSKSPTSASPPSSILRCPNTSAVAHPAMSPLKSCTTSAMAPRPICSASASSCA